ncbi:hypothetical protein KUTeg_011771 [Tegillarca granosa]|uniref:Uncharacterized protein n=1 Tax=Tegillarca granosa TaxID=220873 RepID=A0ABQ9EXL5_TEGGR|nr:hypothetical protein KUTeg_011771 [Tegillarca granosa]
MRKTENINIFLQNKLKKMYFLFDTLLNLMNKNYIGLIQDANSQELAMNYHSINTVFSVSSFAGATLSLNESEKRLKEKAISDFCYYNTYLKKYELTYESDCGIVQRTVNLRDCRLIVLMDNLVRLKYHKDPEPGESRSMQICTLPITVKGLPKDARVVDNWHDANICDTTNECKCKDNNRLTKEEFEDDVICLNKKEKDVVQRFLQMLDWGFLSLWIEIFKKNIWNTLPVLNQANSTRYKDEELKHLASLNVSERMMSNNSILNTI